MNQDCTVSLNNGEWEGSLNQFLEENQLMEAEAADIISSLESTGVFHGFEGAGGAWQLSVIDPTSVRQV